MDKEAEENYSVNPGAGFAAALDYSLDHPSSSVDNSIEMVDYMLGNSPAAPPPAAPHRQFSLDRLSFADVMQFADFGPKLGLSQLSKMPSDDDNFFLKFPVIGSGDGSKVHEAGSPSMGSLPPQPLPVLPIGANSLEGGEEEEGGLKELDGGEEEEEGRFSENGFSSVQQLGFGGGGGGEKVVGGLEVKNRRKRPRSLKTSEEVESQRMTHIAVERNRRRQMNEHLRVLRSLMPGSYVQRGDQASIIGGAIEFVRELEQLLQCLESQKRRRLYGDQAPRNMADAPQQLPNQPPFFPPLPIPGGGDPMKLLDIDPDCGLGEEMAENKSLLADIEVRLLGFDAMIKILSRRRPGQLLKTIAALEDMQLSILHTNITTIEQTVLYSFNVKITSEARFTAEEIASSVQQILGFIDANTIQ